MKPIEAVKAIMQRREVKPSTLAARLSIKPNVMSQRFTQSNVSVDKLNEMLRAMDYKIVVLPRESRIPDNGIEIE